MKAWHQLDLEEVLKSLRSSENGLAAKEIGPRQESYGKNNLEEARKKSRFSLLHDII